MTKPLILPAVIIAALQVCGCRSLFSERFVDPELDLSDSRVLIIPFREGDLWHYESPAGERLARQVMYMLQKKCSVELVDAPEVEKRIRDCLDEQVPWGRFGRRAGAEFLLLGTIESLDYTSREVINMVQGEMKLAVEVWDVETDRSVYRRELRVRYPPDPAEAGVSIFDQTRDNLRRNLFRKVSQEVAKIFCGAMEDTYPE